MFSGFNISVNLGCTLPTGHKCGTGQPISRQAEEVVKIDAL